MAILQERIAKEKQILEERQKANPDKTYTKLAARIKEDENRLAEIIKGGRENGLQGKTETEIITETPPAPLSQTDAATVGVTTDEAKSGESLNNKALIEEARKYKTVDEFVQKTHSKFFANADKLTPEEKELADAFYKSDKEAVWNKAQEATAPAANVFTRMPEKELNNQAEQGVKGAIDELSRRKSETKADRPSGETVTEPPAAGAVAAKQPWEMSAEEVGNMFPNPEGDQESREPWMMPVEYWSAWQAGAFKTQAKPPSDQTKMWHKGMVRDAVFNKKPVPKSVLDIYPDLQKAQGPVAPRKKTQKSLMEKAPPGGWTEADKVPEKYRKLTKTKPAYGLSGMAAFNQMAATAGLTPDNSGDYNDLVNYFETYYNAGLQGKAKPKVDVHPQDAEAAYRAGKKDAVRSARKSTEVKASGPTVLKGTYTSEGDTEKDLRENGSDTPERKFKADLKQYAKKLQDILGYEPDVITKGKKSKDVSVSTNIAPIGGDGHIILWKPNSEYGIYISVRVDREAGIDSIGDFGNDKITVNKKIMYRATTRKDKYTSMRNQNIDGNISAEEFAGKIQSEVDFYDQVKGAKEIIQEAKDEHFSETAIAKVFAEGETAGEAEGADKSAEEIQEKIDEVAADLGVEVKPFFQETGVSMQGGKLVLDHGEVAKAPATENVNKVIPSTKTAEKNVITPKEQKKYLLEKIDENAIDFTEKESKLESEGGEKNVQDDTGTKSVQQSDVDGAPGLDDGQSPGKNIDNVSGKEPQKVPGSQNGAGNGEASSASAEGVKGRPGRGNNQDVDNLTEQRPGTDERGDSGTDTTTEKNDSEMGGARLSGQSGINNRIAPDDVLFHPGKVARINANIRAITTLKKIQAAKRPATAEEKKILQQFSGWGAVTEEVFKDTFTDYLELHEKNPTSYSYSSPEHYFYSPSDLAKYREWESKYGKKLHPLLGGMLTKEEWRLAADSGLNAHYTAAEVINAMWKMAERLGIDQGRVLEPAAGVGHFLGLMPNNLVGKVKLSGIELDSITGEILKVLYPESKIQVTGFEKASLQDNFYDMVISNFPFGDYPIHDANHKAYTNWNIHNYFFARSLDAVRPGGIVLAITSRYTMDSTKNGKVREYLADKADFIGAIRLPGTAFAKNAGTEVVTDIIILQKKTGMAYPNPLNWRTVLPIKTKEGREFNINEYFVNNPDMVLGIHSSTGSMYSDNEYTLLPFKTGTIQEHIEGLIEKLPRNIVKGEAATEQKVELEAATQDEKDGTFVIQNGKIGLVKNRLIQPVSFADNAAKVKRAKEYIAIRDTYKKLIEVMNQDTTTDDEIAALQAKMNDLYDKFVKKNGAFHERANKYLNEDDEYVLALSLEDVKRRAAKKGGIDIVETYYVKGDAFTKRTVYPFREPKDAENIDDAANLSITYRNSINLPFIAGLLNIEQSTAKEQLLTKGLAYENPTTGLLEHPSEYLSGNVRKKLQEAEAAGEKYKNNVESLKKVQPPNKVIDEIPTRLGDEWIPADVVKSFAISLVPDIDVNVVMTSVEAGGESAMVHWIAQPMGYVHDDSPAKTVWGAEGASLYQLIEDSLNLKRTNIYDWIPDEYGNGGKEVLNQEKSIVARQKQKEIQDAFRSYIMDHNDIGVSLAHIFNTEKNNYVIRKYEAPSIDHYPGATKLVNLRDHQKRGVSRGLQSSTIFAHAVGTGKTYLFTTLGMELRRIKAARKPAIIVQGSTIKQFAASARKLYPTAKILALTKDMTNGTENRRTALAKIASGDWDLVILPHSTYNLIKCNPIREAGFIQEQLDEIREAIRSEGGHSPESSKVNRSDSLTVKQLRKILKRKEARLQALRDKPHEDGAIYFEDLGIDALLGDEAHTWKRGDFFTKMDNIKGLDRSASQKSFDFLMKVRYIQEKTGGKNIYLATGTPISNTLAEIWTLMRYTRPELLREYGVEHFDGFASLFTESVSEIEPTETGEFRQVERLKKYRNGYEMINMWLTAADVILQEDVPGWADMVPAFKNGEHTNIVLDRSEELGQVIESIRQRRREWDELSGKEKRNQSYVPLVLYGEAKKAAIDLRMVHPQNPDTPESKSNACVNEAFKRYKESDAIKGTQLIFCDIYQSPDPSAMKIRKDEFGNVISREPKNPHLIGIPRFNLYADIKKKLINKGIPENEIAIINDKKYDKDEAKERLFEMVNDGSVRIVLGSTEKLGTGVNAQERMVAIHNIDAPQRPMDLEQRIGRIIRPGNINKIAEVCNYITVNSLDSKSFNTLRDKIRFVNQVLRGTLEGAEFDDPTSELQQTFEDMIAVALNDPVVIRRFELENQLRELRALSMGWVRKQGSLRENIQKTKEKNVWNTKSLPIADKNAAFLKEKFPPAEKRIITSESGAALSDTALHDTFNSVRDEMVAEYEKIAAEAKKAAEESKTVKTGKGKDVGFSQYEYSNKIRNLRQIKQFNINGVKLELEFDIENKHYDVKDWGEYDFTVKGTLDKGIHEFIDYEGRLKKTDGYRASTSRYKTIRGMLDKLELAIQSVLDNPNEIRASIVENEKNIASMQEELAKPFKFSDKLESLSKELDDILAQLEARESQAQDITITNEQLQDNPNAEQIRHLQDNIKELNAHLKDEAKGSAEYNRLIEVRKGFEDEIKALTDNKGGQQYSIERSEGKAAMPTLPEVQSVFKGQEVTQLADGSFAIKTAGGANLVINSVDHISPNKAALKISYGMGKLEGGDVVAGAYRKGTIQLVRGAAGKWTLHHESVHWMEDIGILTKSEINLLKNHIKNLVDQGKFETVNQEDIGGAEDRANFLADALTKEPKGLLGRIVNKIHDFIDKLVNAFGIRTAGGVARDIRTGKVYDRQGGAGRGLDEYYKVAAWHGSPYDFDKFSKDKIGTGEGAQAYGYGLYFAGKREVAEFYKKRLSSNNDDSPGSAAEWVKYYGSKENALKSAKGQYDNELRFFAGREKEIADVHKTYKKLISELETYSPGRLYQVELAPDEDEYLLWDKPLSEQNEKVKPAFIEAMKKKALPELGNPDINDARYNLRNTVTGAYLYHTLNNAFGSQKAASDYLHSLGIRGIKYLDGTSRNKGEGDYNYVIFSDEDVDIKEKYSIRKSQDPPTSRDPKVLNLYLKDETDAIFQTIYNKLHPKKMTWLETMLKSPEWFGHNEVGRIVKIFMRDRSELYHEYFNDLNMADDIDAPENTVTEAAKALKNKGLSLTERMEGKVSPEYQKLTEFLDYFDTKARRDQNKTDEENLKSCEDYMRRNGATDEVVRVWRLYRDSYDKALVMMTQQLRDLIADLREQAAMRGEEFNLDEMKETLQFALAQMEMWKGYYAPRQREQGNWKVQAYKEHGPLEENREYYREHRPSELSAQRLAKKLQREGWKVYSIGEIEKLPESVYQDVKSVAAAKLIDSALEKVKDKGTGIAAMNSEILQAVADEIRARGFRSTMIHRTEGAVIKGYIEDPIKRHLLYINNISGGMSKAKVARMAMSVLMGDKVMGKQIGGIDPKKDPEAYKVAVNYIEEQLRNLDATDRAIGLAKSIATFKFLGFNVRSAFVNLTSLLTTAPAAIHQYALGGRGSLMGIMKELASAGKDYGSYMAGRKLNAEEMSFLNEMHVKGWDDPQYTRDAMGTIAKVHSQAWSTVMDYAMYMFGQTERFNRGTTILAAYRLARKQGIHIETAKDMAKEASDRAHGVYGRATMPMWAQGTNPAAKIGQMMYVYSKFSHNYLQMLYDMGWKKRNLKGFAFATLAPVVLAGGAAIPFKGALFGMMGIILSALGYDRDPEKFVWDTIREHLGSEAEKVGRHGLTGAMGVDVSGSLSIGVGVPKDFIDLTGAVGGAAESIGQVKEGIANRQPMKALEAVLPTGLASPVRAYREAKEGVSTKNNRPVWDESGRPLVPEASEAAQRALGFRSTRQAVLSERNWEGRREIERFEERRNAIYKKYRAWVLSGRDREEYKQIVSDVQEFNRNIAPMRGKVARITSQSLRDQSRRMERPTKRELAILAD
ncbi:MAG TPA: PLxRFG domain-containing protein [Smithellaceae bacterium]|nr:PLxRFG domain-containing protein [Smithellaceae bacterium]